MTKRFTINTKRRHAVRAALLTATCIAAMPGVAFAQSSDRPDNDIVVTTTRAVTATKTDTAILRIPQTIEVITTGEIQDRGALNIREALKYTAGVNNGGDDSRGDFNIIRGHQSVLYVDGLKRNNGFVFLPRVDVNTLERVEVLVGPASVLYGAGSASGVTNMQSKRPQFEFGGSASISYGTFERKEGVLDVTGPLSDTLAVRFTGVLRDSNSRMDYTPNNRQLAQGAITWKPTPDTDITAIGIYQHDNNPPNYNGVPLLNSLYARAGTANSDRFIPDSRFYGEPKINKGDKDYYAATLLASHEFNDWLTFRSSNRYAWAHTEQAEYYLATYVGLFAGNKVSTGPFDVFFPAGATDSSSPAVSTATTPTSVARNLYAISVKYNTFNTDNNFALKFETGPFKHQVLAGIDYSYFKNAYRQVFIQAIDTIDIFNPVYGNAPAPVFGALTTEVAKQTGFYLQDQIDFGELASLTLGIRHDRFRQTQDGATVTSVNVTTKRAGLTVNVTPTLAPYVSYSESFLPQLGQSQFGQSFLPFEGKQKEIGIKWQPLRSTMLRVSLYDLEENNAFRTDPLNPFRQTQSGFKKSRGVEFQANHNVRDDLSLIAAFSYGTVEDSGVPYQADGVPEYLASLYATKTVVLTDDLKMRVGGGVRYQGSSTARSTGPIVVSPSYTLADANVAFDYKSWTLLLNAVNLFDQQYYPTCSAYGCTNGEPRTLQATLSFKF